MKSIANVYFDESGFTGNNLLHKQQKYFSYASVVSDDNEAQALVDHIIRKYQIQNGEIKGGKLVKKVKGRRAIDEIIGALTGRIKVSISDKKYALAGKFFEYIFEPSLQRNSMLFYNANFHKFVSTVLYIELTSRGAMAEELFEDFEKLMRNGDFNGLKALFTATKSPEMSPVLELIFDFAIMNKEAIVEELDGYAGEGSGKWVLDLTNTALFSILAQWGLEYDELTAFCDNSKPLSEDQEIFTAMIGNESKTFSSVAGVDNPITFNLKEPLNLVDSKDVHGVQLADAVAAAFVYACDSKNQDEHAKKWRSLIEDVVIYGSVFPDYDHIDLSRLEVQRNLFVLKELVLRSENKQCLLDGMPNFMAYMTHVLQVNPMFKQET
ncbi:DUF3800 domain-containing protein [Psychromonas sp. Urea-02u-13]|uniref:DUF3800 domain-containing protein n=1 Tax=Psychromonas sp. Urea-02u-13 TaxID=2058326 RepID=UPI000C327BF9|nr:DUF3800 domain-containing protein [Psychromonas sp. Urea-02u-13]PKG37308.1 hypothetical protein CXF74_19535 [Psychromonas sp. Urea-02u-13]